MPQPRAVRIGRAVLVAVACRLLSVGASAGEPLPRSSPEAQGVSSAQLREFVEAANGQVKSMHSFMLVRHGHVVAEGWWKPQGPDVPHQMWSVSKSFTSTAVGMAIAEGKFGLDDPVLGFFPEFAPAEPSENLRAMRVRDLLAMSTGHATQPPLRLESPSPLSVRSFLAHPVEHRPGTHFLYNTPATYVLSAIVQKTTGQPVLEYLRPRLFEPLGVSNATWGMSEEGVTLGGWDLHICTEDLAKFGQLYLQQGEWQGKELVPAWWVTLATSRQVANDRAASGVNKPDWRQGYGFQFWRCTHGAFRADGKAGQFCIVLPEHDAVVAMTAETKDMQAQLNLVWEKLLPAFAAEPMPANAAAESQLRATLDNLP